MSRGRLDNLIMLLSSDWFSGHWADIGVDIDDRKMAVLREECREIVRHLMGDARTYAGVSYKPERIKQTMSELSEALIESQMHDQQKQLLLELAGEYNNLPMTSDFVMRFGALINLLISDNHLGDVDGIDQNAKSAVVAGWELTDPAHTDYEKLYLESQSNWDNYLRQLSPDQPTKLSDFLRWSVLEELRIKSFWKTIAAKFSTSQRTSLLKWFERNSPSLVGNDFSPPAWLK